MYTHKFYGKTLAEWFQAYSDHFENDSFPTMEYQNSTSEELARMAKEAIETDTPIYVDYSNGIKY